MRVTIVMRPPWADRFRTPTAEALIAGMRGELRGMATTLRRQLLAVNSASESAAWLGTWQWTLQFRIAGASEAAWAYVIPNPDKLQLCVPVRESVVAVLPTGVVSSAMRQALVRAPMVDGVRWVTWDVGSASQAITLARFAAAVAKAEGRGAAG
jgi:hypothetical protein